MDNIYLIHKETLLNSLVKGSLGLFVKPSESKLPEGMLTGDFYGTFLESRWMTVKPVQYGSTLVIPISGCCTYNDSFMELMQESNYCSIIDYIQAAVLNTEVDKIILKIDSPGGVSSGLLAVVEAIKEASKVKAIIAYTETIAASAAYWMAAACDEIILGNELAYVGSIGVYRPILDKTKALDTMGYKVTEVIAGEYKALGSSLHTATENELNKIQEEVNNIYTTFTTSTATLRETSLEAWLPFCDGRVYSGQFALNNNLADRISTLSKELNMTTTTTTTPNITELTALVTTLQTSLAENQATLTTVQAENTSLSSFKNEIEKTKKETEAKEKLSSFFKETLKREAKPEEVASFISLTAPGQTAYLEVLKETFKNINVTKLKTEVATGGPAEDTSGKSLLSEAMKSLQK